MDDATLGQSVIGHLQQAHAMERAQLGELKALAAEIGIPVVSELLERHRTTTRRHGDLIEARLEELSSGNSMMLLAQAFGASLPKLVVDHVRPMAAAASLRDAISAEALEVASYLLLEAEALRAGDESTATLAAEIRADEAEMLAELQPHWQAAVDLTVAQAAERSGSQDETRIARAMMIDHLRDVHALEQSIAAMLASARSIVRDETARERIDDHRSATQRHAQLVSGRLAELRSGPSLRRQAQGYAAAMMKAPLSIMRADRVARELRDMYVNEHVELAAYGQLAALARRAGDDRTLQLADVHAREEAAMVEWLEREAGRFALQSLATA